MTAWTTFISALACTLGLSACAALRDARGGPEEPSAQLQLTSSAFLDQQPLSTRYTCEGDEVSPPLRWSQLPARTRSLVLIVDDAESGQVFTHWLLYDLPPSSMLAEGVKSTHLPLGARQARNDAATTTYHGPCPTSGRQRYHFKLYALDTTLPDLDTPTRPQLETAMQGHILATGELVGTYERKQHDPQAARDEHDPDAD
jgi:Raf kinase inhibitor-like YbhB/YbcL family protein